MPPLRTRRVALTAELACTVVRGESTARILNQLIEQGATDEFHPEKYHDQVRDRIREAIQAKVEGQEITAEPEAQPQTKIIDLMEALKASLGKAEKSEGKKSAAKSSKATKAKPKARKAS